MEVEERISKQAFRQVCMCLLSASHHVRHCNLGIDISGLPRRDPRGTWDVGHGTRGHGGAIIDRGDQVQSRSTRWKEAVQRVQDGEWAQSCGRHSVLETGIAIAFYIQELLPPLSHLQVTLWWGVGHRERPVKAVMVSACVPAGVLNTRYSCERLWCASSVEKREMCCRRRRADEDWK